jgi:hypothetical protein
MHSESEVDVGLWTVTVVEPSWPSFVLGSDVQVDPWELIQFGVVGKSLGGRPGRDVIFTVDLPPAGSSRSSPAWWRANRNFCS